MKKIFLFLICPNCKDPPNKKCNTEIFSLGWIMFDKVRLGKIWLDKVLFRLG